ncbi:hypothetical protein AGMMS49938_12340 [Fibrobacterales bacterium]|nr:hypothetical protein AGMMS49938_12340 [Fibrobacterales bacterium]
MGNKTTGGKSGGVPPPLPKGTPLKNPVFLFVLLFLLVCSCDKDEAEVVLPPATISGRIEVLNSSGLAGAATEFSDFLKAHGFDVLKIETDPQWNNYAETIIALRNPHWQGNNALRSKISTENFITLQDSSKWGIDATIYVGKDYKKIIGNF